MTLTVQESERRLNWDLCYYCGDSLPAHDSPNMIYCCGAHRTAAHRARMRFKRTSPNASVPEVELAGGLTTFSANL